MSNLRKEFEQAGISAVDAVYQILESQRKMEALVSGFDTRLRVIEMQLTEKAKVTKAEPAAPISPTISMEDDGESEDADETEQIIMAAIKPKEPVREVAPLPQPTPPAPPPFMRQQKIEMFPEMEEPGAASEDGLKTKVFGKLKDKGGEPMPGVNIKILDVNSKLVKSTRTSTRGDWMAFVDPGEYIAEFTKAGMKPFFKPITIAQGQKKLEI